MKLLATLLLAIAGMVGTAQAQDTSIYWKAKLAHVEIYDPVSRETDCGGTALSPSTFVSSLHCVDSREVLINGTATKITIIATDINAGNDALDTDNVLVRTAVPMFKHYVRVGKMPDIGEDVFVWGQPGGVKAQLRKGYRMGEYDHVWGGRIYHYHTYDFAGFNGDSGSGLFNSKGEVVGTVYGMFTWMYFNPNGMPSKAFTQMYVVPYKFTKKQWAEAGVVR